MSTNYHALKYPFESLSIKRDDTGHMVITASGHDTFIVSRCPESEVGTITSMVIKPDPAVYTYFGGTMYGRVLAQLSGFTDQITDSTVLVSEYGDVVTLGELRKQCQTDACPSINTKRV